jgi:hypothetical protein
MLQLHSIRAWREAGALSMSGALCTDTATIELSASVCASEERALHELAETEEQPVRGEEFVLEVLLWFIQARADEVLRAPPRHRPRQPLTFALTLDDGVDYVQRGFGPSVGQRRLLIQ